jgi:type I restriction enzyme M protein
MPLKKSELYSSLWQSCDELRGGMDASQYKDYVLVLLFVKYVSDKAASQKGYFTYAAIIICAIFSILIFWKLRDIADELRKFRIAFEMADNRKTQSAAPAPLRADDDSRYLPKS